MRVWDAAEYLGIPESTLNQLRSSGGGPPYIKIGRSILYDVHDLDAWIKAKKFKSTADYAAAR
jgi:excisionase family DNA binding protein